MAGVFPQLLHFHMTSSVSVASGRYAAERVGGSYFSGSLVFSLARFYLSGKSARSASPPSVPSEIHRDETTDRCMFIQCPAEENLHTLRLPVHLLSHLRCFRSLRLPFSADVSHLPSFAPEPGGETKTIWKHREERQKRAEMPPARWAGGALTWACSKIRHESRAAPPLNGSPGGRVTRSNVPTEAKLSIIHIGRSIKASKPPPQRFRTQLMQSSFFTLKSDKT